MNNKQKANWELTLKNVLYYVEDEAEQEKMLAILEEYNDRLPDGKFKDRIQKFILKSKKDYWAKVDYLVDDILDGKYGDEQKQIIAELVNEIKPVVEQAEKNFWQKLCDLFKWS